uniref:Reverse transcriptase domain-containing protein n=1 Tax=Tanacetum cinerariifolium TaxID=118510 RepID=A0A6L2NU41_TANCI|nr:reverse transcriptase domain-containing protein [Tanacetum cinerariifolium]
MLDKEEHQKIALIKEKKPNELGRNLEAYIDDMVIKSNDEKVLLPVIAETFDNLCRINMKLNPKNCSFEIEDRKFLGYMVTYEWIQANSKKTKALADMQSPITVREMQSLSGKLASLKRFLARSIERMLNETKKNYVPTGKASSISITYAMKVTKEVLVEVLSERSIVGKEINIVVEEEEDNLMTLSV